MYFKYLPLFGVIALVVLPQKFLKPNKSHALDFNKLSWRSFRLA